MKSARTHAHINGIQGIFLDFLSTLRVPISRAGLMYLCTHKSEKPHVFVISGVDLHEIEPKPQTCHCALNSAAL